MDENFIKARMLYYVFFSEVLSFFKDEKSFQKVKEKVKILSKSPINEEAKMALENMSEFLKKGYDALKEEQNEVFYSPVTSFIPISASFYDEKRDDGKKRVQMIDFIKEAGFVKDESFEDSEDNFIFIFMFMFTLLEKMDVKSLEISKRVFENLLDPFVDEFIQRVYIHEKSEFYKNVAVLMDIFMKLERLNRTK